MSHSEQAEVDNEGTHPEGDMGRLHDRVAPGVVRIGRHGGRGCGFVFDEGVVVTNAHNLRDQTTEVRFADGRAAQARALAVDADGDLAALAVDTGDAPRLAWADEPVRLGDRVFSVVRLGSGTRVTAGAVSSTERSFRGPRGRRVSGAIEHTAPLARGSSGSPLVDPQGRLVGVSTLRLGDGFTIALAADTTLRERVERLRTGQEPRRRLLGVALAPAHISRRLRRSVGLPHRDGVLVRHVERESPGERAGIRSGDLITQVGDVAVTSVDDVASALDAAPADGLQLHVVRGSEEVDLLVRFDDTEQTASSHGEA